MADSNSNHRSPSNNSLLRRFARSGFAVATLAGAVSLAGCSEEHKVQTRRAPRERSIAAQRSQELHAETDLHAETEPSTDDVATVRHAGFESTRSAPTTCAPDMILTAGTTSSPSRSVMTLAQMNAARSPAEERASITQVESSPITESTQVTETSQERTSSSVADFRALLRQAEEHNRLGLHSAAKGAVFSARTEFLAALRLVAAALDAHHQTKDHAAALAAGLTALTEAEDFAPLRERPDAEIDLAPAIRSHTTQIVSESVASTLTATAIRELYADFAWHRLTDAVAGSPTGSAALHRLGKVALLSASHPSTKDARGKARVFLEAAIAADADNFPAANDLAVHLAEDGYYDRAIAVLRDGLARAPQPAMWNNLAAIHDRRGEPQLAHAARLEARGLASRGNSAAGVLPSHNVAWVDARAFAAAARPNLEMQTGAAPVQQSAARPTHASSQPPTATSATPQRAPISTALTPRRNAMVQ